MKFPNIVAIWRPLVKFFLRFAVAESRDAAKCGAKFP